MREPSKYNSYPRIATSIAWHELLQILVSQSLRELRERCSDPNLEGAKFHHLAENRVTSEKLKEVRGKVLSVAGRFGYPGERIPKLDSGETFDQALAVELHSVANLSPAEAADIEIWYFLTLRVFADVALWRWPVGRGLESPSEAPRWMDRRRNLFRQAWWRGYVLGAEYCRVFNEDEFQGIIDRAGLSGFRLLAIEIAHAHNKRLEKSGYSRRIVFREALKLIRRKLAQLSVYSLSETARQKVVENAFDEAERVVAASSGREMREDTPALELFLDLAFSFSHFLDEQSLDAPQNSGMILQRIWEYESTWSRVPEAKKIAMDFLSLLTSDDDLDSLELRVIDLAVSYFVLEEDAVPDAGLHGFEDDDEIASFAFQAIGRIRSSEIMGE